MLGQTFASPSPRPQLRQGRIGLAIPSRRAGRHHLNSYFNAIGRAARAAFLAPAPPLEIPKRSAGRLDRCELARGVGSAAAAIKARNPETVIQQRAAPDGAITFAEVRGATGHGESLPDGPRGWQVAYAGNNGFAAKGAGRSATYPGVPLGTLNQVSQCVQIPSSRRVPPALPRLHRALVDA